MYNKCVIIGGEKMNCILSMDCKNLLQKQNINFKKAELNEIDKILEVFSERMQWFREKKIKQWGKYLEHHPKSEFEEVICKRNYFILERNNEIVAGFELSTDSKYWDDNKTKAYYIYKLVTRVGNKGIGNIVFDICKDLAKANNKEYLRLDCLSTNKKLNDIYESHSFKLVKTGCKEYYHYSLRECKIY